MKRYTSVMALAVRALLGKVLAVTAATAAIQLGLSWLMVQADSRGYTLELLQQESWTPQVAVLGLAGILALTALHGSPLSGVQTGYTLRRLPVSEKTVTVLWALVYLGFLLLFWAAEVGVTLLQQHWTWPYYDEPAVSREFLWFSDNYSGWFFHSLLPLYDWPRSLRNGIWLVALAWSASAFSYHQRHGSFSLGILVLLILGALLISMGNNAVLSVLDLVLTFLMALVTAWSFQALGEGESDHA